MAAQRFLALVAGRMKQVAAILTSAGAGDADKIPALGVDGRLDASFMPVGIGADTKIIVASEALASGDLVNTWDDSGTLKVRKADATAEGKEAHGFVLAAVLSGANATVYFEGRITGLSGLAGSTRYYLDTTAGQITTTPPSTAGNVVQYVGNAAAASELNFEPSDPITVA